MTYMYAFAGVPFRGVKPALLASPVIQHTAAPVAQPYFGTPRSGYSFTVTNGTWSGSPTNYAYQWQADGQPISGATSANYTLTNAEKGKQITCQVTASNLAGEAYAFTAKTLPVLNDAITVREITMAAPDVIRIEVWEQNIGHGDVVQLAAPDTTNALYSLVQRTNPYSGLLEYCYLCGQANGQTRMFWRFVHTEPTVFLNRTVAYNYADYTLTGTGAPAVTNLYVVAKPYQEGVTYPTGSQNDRTTFRHYIFLQLASALPAGTYTIACSGNPFPSTQFIFNDKAVRACSIHSTVAGHRPGDGKKYAYLSQWIPGYGTHGRVDFANTYGITQWHLIDSLGNIVYTKSLPAPYAPTTSEPLVPATSTNNAGFLYYPTSTTQPKVLTGIATGNPTVITLANHGYANGDIKMLDGIGGLAQPGTGATLQRTFVQVANVTTNTFQVNTLAGAAIDTTGWNAYVSGTYQAGYDSLVFDVIQANRSNTFVYTLDYSDFQVPKYDQYRVYIAGLGVSDSFPIDEAAYYPLLRQAFKAYYNECDGIALDPAVGDYLKPVSFRDGTNGVIILESSGVALPSSEVSFATPQIPATNLGKTPFLTAVEAIGWFGGWRDAGDWDYYLCVHYAALLELMLLPDLCAGSSAITTEFGFPKSSTTLDPVLYAGTETLSDIYHMPTWYLDPFRRLQKSDGRVYGGLCFNGAFSNAGGGGTWEASWNSTVQAVVLAADHYSNYCYAAAAAKLAYLFSAAGFTSLAATWQTSAINAFNWAENIYQDYLANGATGSVVQTYYNGTINLSSNAGWTTTQFSQFMASFSVAVPRTVAAAELYRLTGTASYDTIVSASVSSLSDVARWDYVQTNGSAVSSAKTSITTYANNTFAINLTGSEQPYLYCSGGDFFAPAGGTGLALALKVGTSQNQQNAYLQLIQAGVSFWTGANQAGQVVCQNLSDYWRSLINGLQQDALASGVPQPSGIWNYTWWWNFSYGQFNFSTDSTLNFTVCYPTTSDRSRVLQPASYYEIPAYEQIFDNSFLSALICEFTTEGTNIPMYVAIAFLHGWDGNTTTELSPITGLQISAWDTTYSDAAVGTVVGTVTTSGVTGTPSYSLTGNAGGAFAINASTGDLTVAAALTAQTYQVQASVNGVSPAQDETIFFIYVNSPPVLSYTPLTAGAVSYTYNGATPTITGGVAPFTYSVSAGTLPSGLTLNTSTGVISGSPTATGTQTGIVLRATDNNGRTVDSAPFQIAVQASFAPNLVTPNLWIEAGNQTFQNNDGTTAASASGNPVGFWTDLSGNAFNLASAADDTTRPTLNGVGVHPHVDFDGVNDLLFKIADLGIYNAKGCSVFIALQANPASGAHVLLGESASSGTPFYQYQSNSTTSTTAEVDGRSNSSGLFLNAAAQQTSAFDNTIRVVGFIDSAGTVTPYLGQTAGTDTASYSFSANPTTLDRFFLGGKYTSAPVGGVYFNVQVYGLVIVDRALTTQEKTALVTYLGNLAGLSL